MQTDQQPDLKLVNETSLMTTTVWSLKQTVELPSFLTISIYIFRIPNHENELVLNNFSP